MQTKIQLYQHVIAAVTIRNALTAINTAQNQNASETIQITIIVIAATTNSVCVVCIKKGHPGHGCTIPVGMRIRLL